MENPTINIISELNKIYGNLRSCYSSKISFILSHLDLSIFNVDTKHFIFTLESLIKLYIFKRVKGFSTYNKTEEYFNENQHEAIQLGFYRDQNNKLLFPKKRTFNYFLQKNKEIINTLDSISEKILVLATKNNIVLDIEIVNKTIKNNEEKRNQKNQAIKETIRLVKRLIYPKVNIKINRNAKFTTKDLLDILVHVAYSHDFANNGCDTFLELNPNLKVPNSDTMLYHFKKFNDIDNIEEMFRNIFDFIFNFAKTNYSLLNKREVDIAIDINKLPYYGKEIYPNYIKGGIAEGVGTRKFFHFISCSIVIAGKRFTIDAIPIHFSDNLEDLVDRLVKRAKSKVKIRHCYLDRGFNGTKVINVLKQNNIKFIMPQSRMPTVKAWFDKTEDCKAKVVKDFRIGENTIVNLVLVDDEDGLKRAFITNLDIPEQLAHYMFKFYSNRWGIETSYRQIDNDFLARTTSRNYFIRLFYFLFSVCLYNLWVLTNICVSLIVYGRLFEKPVVTSKLFAIILYKIKEEYIDPG